MESWKFCGEPMVVNDCWVAFSIKNMLDGLSLECYEFMTSSQIIVGFSIKTWTWQMRANMLQVCNHRDASTW